MPCAGSNLLGSVAAARETQTESDSLTMTDSVMHHIAEPASNIPSIGAGPGPAAGPARSAQDQILELNRFKPSLRPIARL